MAKHEAKRVTKPIIYTAEYVQFELDNMLTELRGNESITILGELFSTRSYSPQRFSEWEDKFADDESISESIKKIKSILETRLNLGGLNNKLNATMTIFNLKNNYGWKDRTETDITTKGESINTPPMSTGDKFNAYLEQELKSSYEAPDR